MPRKTSDGHVDIEARKAFDELSAKFDNLRESLSDVAEAVTDYGTAQSQWAAERASGSATDALDQARDASRKHGRQVTAQAGELKAQADDFVSRQPQLALGIAAGAGFLVGLWAARR